MLTRIVKMTFKEEKIPDFIKVFDEVNHKIVLFEGCQHLNLYQDKKDKRIFFTYSIWDNEEALNNYRYSDFFQDTWSKTKILFDDKPEAWSLDLRH